MQNVTIDYDFVAEPRNPSDSEWIFRKRTAIANDIISKVCGRRYDKASLSGLMMDPEKMNLISEWIKSKKNMLVYLGNPGCGKTYFCAALIRYCWPKFESCRYWNEADLIQQLHECVRDNQNYIKGLNHFVDDELIIYDDVGSIGFTDWRKEVFFEFLDFRYNSMKPTVITSNMTRKEITESFHPRVASRLFAKENTIIEVEEMDKRQN
jgi:DNA replication protein DnaC